MCVDNIGTIKGKYRDNSKRCFINPAQRSSESGTHGGEGIAVNKFLDAKPVPKHILAQIQEQFSEPLHFAAFQLRLGKKTALKINPYFGSGQGLSDDNWTIMLQTHALQKLSGKSMIIVGDFNNTAKQLEEAGWLDLLNVQPIIPEVGTTFKCQRQSYRLYAG